MVSVEAALKATTAATDVAASADKLETADKLTTVAGAIVGVRVEEATKAAAAGSVTVAAVVSELVAVRDAAAERTPAMVDSELAAASATVGRTVSMAVAVSVLAATSLAVVGPGAPVLRTSGRKGLRRNPRPALAMGYHLDALWAACEATMVGRRGGTGALA